MSTVFNPVTYKFPKSPSHDALLFDGTPALTNYIMQVVPSLIFDLGKPVPDAQGNINGTVAGLPIVIGGPYSGRIICRGPGGDSPPNEASEIFGFAPLPFSVPSPVVFT